MPKGRAQPHKPYEPKQHAPLAYGGLEAGQWHVSDPEDLGKWVHGMCQWAQRVREDIQHIEEFLKLPQGDPGPPPPPPE
jgi:hypothetical protein